MKRTLIIGLVGLALIASAIITYLMLGNKDAVALNQTVTVTNNGVVQASIRIPDDWVWKKTELGGVLIASNPALLESFSTVTGDGIQGVLLMGATVSPSENALDLANVYLNVNRSLLQSTKVNGRVAATFQYKGNDDAYFRHGTLVQVDDYLYVTLQFTAVTDDDAKLMDRIVQTLTVE